MSVVSGVTLITHYEDDEGMDGAPDRLQTINAWLEAHGFSGLHRVEDHYAGNKHPQCQVSGGGFNHFPEDEFAQFVAGLQWDDPENVVLVIQPEQGPTRIWRPGFQDQVRGLDGKLTRPAVPAA